MTIRILYEHSGHTLVTPATTDFDAQSLLGWRCEWASEQGTRLLVFLDVAENESPRLKIERAKLKNFHPVVNHAALRLAELVAERYFADFANAIALMLPPYSPALIKKSRSEMDADPKNTKPEAAEIPSLFDQPLNAKQQEVFTAITNEAKNNIPEHLIWGITGSGKTRIYLHLIADCLKRSGQVLLLVPEIALSTQIMEAVTRHFAGQVVLYHSGLSDGERLQSQQAFLSGKAAIAVGTRSAVFLPAKRLQLIIIDEEHDAAYKDMRQLRFDAREIARLRLITEPQKPRLVLGSATPALESLFRAKAGKAELYRLRERATGQSLPKVHIPPYHPQHGLISPFLMEKMHEHLAQKNQVLLMMNRRGHSTHVYCPSCARHNENSRTHGGYIECPRCSVALAYHKDNTLRCHYCGYLEQFTRHCPKDGELRQLSGRGIQKVEDILEKQFSQYAYARLDRDTAQRKHFAAEVLADLRERKIDILIGTQMIAKGFDIEHVTLVGVLSIDPILNAPDYRASEQGWQLLSQVTGRAGRHKPGEVVIQTMQPQHPAIVAAAQHNPDRFYGSEAQLRQLTGYPPFGALARILLRSSDQARLLAVSEKLAREIAPVNTSELFGEADPKSIELLGPASPSHRKLNNEFRVHFLVKSRTEEELRNYLRRILPICKRLTQKDSQVNFTLDIDPRDTL